MSMRILVIGTIVTCGCFFTKLFEFGCAEGAAIKDMEALAKRDRSPI